MTVVRMTTARKTVVIAYCVLALVPHCRAQQFEVKSSPIIESGPSVMRPSVPPASLPAPAPESAWTGVTNAYVGAGLPVPRDGSSLVMFKKGFIHCYPWSTVYLGFLEDRGGEDGRPDILVGVAAYSPPMSELLPMEQRPYMVLNDRVIRKESGPGLQTITNSVLSRVPEAVWAGDLVHNAVMATAVQLRMTGERELSGRLLAYGLSVKELNICREGATEAHGIIYKAGVSWNALDRVGDLAWCYWMNRVKGPDTNSWPAVLKRLDAVQAQYPAVMTSNRVSLLSRLRAAVNAPKASSEVEACLLMIPADMCRDQHRTSEYRIRILGQGLDAVPELKRLIDDCRLTCYRLLPVGHFAGMLLKELSLGELSTDDLAAENRMARIDAWKNRVREKGEEAFYSSRLDKEPAAYVLAGRFPDRLPGLIRKAVSADSDTMFNILAALPITRLSRDEKIELLGSVVRVPDLDSRRAVLRSLAELGSDIFVTNLVMTLDELPTDTSSPELWTCPEASFTRLVVGTTDQRVWDAFLRFTRRAGVGLRLESLGGLYHSCYGTNAMPQRLRCLSNFLDDREVRDMAADRGKYSGPCAGFTFKKITVRQFAAMSLGTLLGLPERPAPDWTEKQWEDFLLRVRSELRKSVRTGG